MFKAVLLSFLLVYVSENEAARILAYYPTPSISHQVVFRPLALELAKRGHEVVVITPDPIFPKKDGPANLREIDVHDISYELWKGFLNIMMNRLDNGYEPLMLYFLNIVEAQMNNKEVKDMMSDKSIKFDLVIVEAFIEVGLGFSHYYKAPAIQFGSLAAGTVQYKQFGVPIHPVIYPNILHERILNLTAWEKIHEWYGDYRFEQILPRNLEVYQNTLRRLYGPDVPPIQELIDNFDMLFLNAHAIWDFNRPVPPNVIYLGGLHQKPQKELPEDLKSYLDSSKNGVIYVSFGTNVEPALFPPEVIQKFINVFSKLPYDILWKWNKDELPGKTANIRISKWLPQSDLLRHPKIKLFITQGGLQSTDEAITAGVPLLGIPIFGDQKFNVEQYLKFKLGERVEIESITEEKLSNAINAVLTDDSYRKNVEKMRTIMNDQPQSPLEKAVWWTEYVIRHKGAKHLRAPGANMSFVDYYEVKLIGSIVLGLLLALSLIVYLIYFVCLSIFGRNNKVKRS